METTETDTGGDDHETRSENRVLPKTTSLAVSESADADETAAIAAAVGAHLRDRAAARAATTTDALEPCDRWKLRNRFDSRELPRGVACGEEWKAAARSR